MAYPMHRGALIGCGFIANQKHLPALAKLENRIQLVAFCDLVEERAKGGKGIRHPRRGRLHRLPGDAQAQ